MPKRTRAEKAAAEKDDEKEDKQEAGVKPTDVDEDRDENFTTFQVPFKKDKFIPCEKRQCSSPPSASTLIFTHGAGGGLESAAMRSFATGFSRSGDITSFQGNMNLTSRVGMFRTLVNHHREERKDNALVLGGRSMGARAAVLAALEMIEAGEQVEALVLVSYPLTASKNGKQEREFERREKILLDLPDSVNVLFVSGTRDIQCELDELKDVLKGVKAKSWMIEVRGADHGMGLTPKAGTSEIGELMGEVAARWVSERDEERRGCEVYWDEEDWNACQTEWQGKEPTFGQDARTAKKRKKD